MILTNFLRSLFLISCKNPGQTEFDKSGNSVISQNNRLELVQKLYRFSISKSKIIFDFKRLWQKIFLCRNFKISA